MPDSSQNFYELLGVNPDVTNDELRSHYRKLAFMFHPDHHVSLDPEKIAEHSARMSELNRAYEVLSNPQKRSAYDRYLSGQDLSDTSFFYGSQRYPGDDECMLCGYHPAIHFVLFATQGKIFSAFKGHIEAITCRECGISLFRDVQNRTLIQGWWGITAVFSNLSCLAKNFVVYLKLRDLDKPTAPETDVLTPFSKPQKRGRPLIARSGMWVTAILATIAALLIRNSLNQPYSPQLSKYEPTGSGFTINFPAKATESSGTSPVGNYYISSKMYEGWSNGTEFIVLKSVWPTQAVQIDTLSTSALDSALKGAAYDIAKNLHGSIVNSTYSQFQGYESIDAGMSVTISQKVYHAYIRIFFIGNSQYSLMSSSANRSDFNAFADSFHSIGG